VGVGVGLGVEAREEGQHPVEGQAQQAYAYPPRAERTPAFSMAAMFSL
jgi:hypothetical protein